MLQNNGTDTVSVSTNGSFAFPALIANALQYVVSIFSNPLGQLCSATNATGAISSASITNISVSCLTVPIFGAFAGISKTIASGPFSLVPPSSTGNGSFSYASSDSLVATVSGGTCTPRGAGTAVISASQAAAGGYSSGTATTTITVTGACELMDPCQSRGTCTNVSSVPGGPRDTFSCACNAPYSDEICGSSDVNCSQPETSCLNGGTCSPSPSGGECACAPCYKGVQCAEYDSIACPLD